MNRILPFLLLAFLVFSNCKQDHLDNPLDIRLRQKLDEASQTGSHEFFILPDADDFEAIPNQEPANPVTAEKAALGKLLFFEPGIAQAPFFNDCYETYSCASCHLPEAGFTPGRIQGIADGGIGYGENRTIHPGYAEDQMDIQSIRPLSVLNAAYVTNTFWSGQFGATDVNEGTESLWSLDPVTEVNFTGMKGLECQNIEGLEVHRMLINDRVLDDFGYREYFDAAFPDFPEEERYDDKTASFAISAYLRTLITNEAPFQDWLKGKDEAMTDAQKRGALLFLGKARCIYCHKNPSFNSVEFHALGTKDLYETGAFNTSIEDKKNLGRGGFTGNEDDMYQFKVPQLYNVKDYATFFHGSSKQTLEEVIRFKNDAVSENP